MATRTADDYITINLSPEDEAHLNDIAAQKGQSADTFACSLFAGALADFKARHDVPADTQPLPEVELSPKEEAEAINLGLDASFAGRVTPLAEWSTKVRARHNLPEGAEAMTHEEAMRLP